MESGQMKKQRGLQIVLSAAVASGQLALGLSAFAQEAQLRPATEAASLQPVPATQTTVIPVVYLPFADSPGQSGQPTTSVNAELQKLVQQSGNTSSRGQGTRAGSNIQLVQMSSDESNSNAGGDSKKPGFFKRLFGGNKSKQMAGVGQPAPPIPKPPAISYETNGSRRNQSKTKSQVPTMPASFGDVNSMPTRTASATAAAQSGYQNQKPGTGGNFSQASGNRVTQDSSGFINPFDRQDLTFEEEMLLDLDSLIEDSPVAAAPSAQTVSDATVQPAQVADSVQQRLQQTPAGPYTGYQLDVNESFEQQPEFDASAEVEQPLPRVVSQQEGRSQMAASGTESVRRLPIVESMPEVNSQPEVAVQPQVQFDEIPLLEEPEMALPVVVDEAPRQQQQLQIQSIPLLEEEFVSVSEVDEAQTAVREESAKAIPPVEPAAEPVRKEPVRPAQTAAERMAELEQRARQDQQAYRIMSRTGQTGFKGFCPVELRDGRQLVDSRPEYKAKFGLQTYYFSSPESKTAFEANPARYAPAVGGSDIVLLVNTNEEVVGNLEFSLWYRDRLYLFRSRETRKIFSDNPLRFADQY